MQNLNSEDINKLRLSLISGVGPRTFIEIIQKFQSITNFLQNANLNEYSEIIKKFDEIEIDKYLAKLGSLNVNFTCLYNENYPRLLSNIYDPPIILYYKGSLDISRLNSEFLFSIVGSRVLNEYGKKITKEFASRLSQDLLVVSGMAFGADYIAHEESLKNNKPTIAVLASSVEKPTPLSNKRLYDNILQNGLVVSEYPIGSEPVPGNFPQRNRIVSGLSLGTLVTQARMDSGSLITPKLALDQGREAFAIPGLITDVYHAGTNWLIQTGQAQLVIKPEDILSSLNLSSGNAKKRKDFKAQNEIQGKLLKLIQQGEFTVDEISTKLKIPVQELNIQVSILEMEGVISRSEIGKLS